MRLEISPSFLQKVMKLKTLSRANQVPAWASLRHGSSRSGTEKSGGFCLVFPCAILSSNSKNFCRTALACWK